MQQTTPPQKSIRFTGRSFMAFVLTPVPPIADWLAEFDAFARRSPGFFAGRPVVVDISLMPPSRPELVHMVTELKRRNIVIMGLDGRAPGELGADARGLPPILSGGKEIAGVVALAEQQAALVEGRVAPAAVTEAAAAAIEAAVTAAAPAPDDAVATSPLVPAAPAGGDAAAPEPVALPSAEAAPAGALEQPAAAEAAGETLIVDAPVRSGQSIVHLKGDVVVIGPVASGAEIVASGSIHVYGALRGRAIAGSNGKRDARIFATALHAELVAIDGLYKTSEDLESAVLGRPVQAWLDGDTLKMTAFNGRA